MLTPDTKLALTFDNAPFTGSLSIYAAINALGFVISILTGSHLHLDLLGTGAFTLASLPTLLSATSLRVALSSAAVCTWGAKLAGFLFFRALKVKTDGRLDGTLSTASGACEYTHTCHV
jgi:steroid 5-alpha reductase family enzyme